MRNEEPYAYVMRLIRQKIPYKVEAELRESQYVAILFSILEEPQQNQLQPIVSNQQKAADLILKQLSERGKWMTNHKCKQYLEKIISVLVKCHSFKLRKACEKIASFLVGERSFLLVQLNNIFLEMLKGKSETSILFRLFLVIVKAYLRQLPHYHYTTEKIDRFAKVMRATIQIYNEALPEIVKLFKDGQNHKNSYLLVKINWKICKAYAYDKKTFSSMTMLLPFTFQIALSTHPDYDVPQFVACDQKDSQIFFYSHAKKWATKIVDRVFKFYRNYGYYYSYIYYTQIEEQSIWRSWKETWIYPYVYQVLLNLPRKAPKKVQQMKIQIIKSLYYYYFEFFEQYLEISLIQIFPSCIVISEEDKQRIEQNKFTQFFKTKNSQQIDQHVRLWSQMVDRVLKQADCYLIDEIIDSIEDRLNSSDVGTIFVGLKLLANMIRKSSKVGKQITGRLRSIIKHALIFLFSSSSIILQKAVFHFFNFQVQNKRYSSQMDLSLLFDIQDFLLSIMTSICKNNPVYFLQIMKEWVFNEQDSFPRMDQQNIENMNYIFTIKYLQRAVKIYSTEEQLTNNLLEPLFHMLAAFYQKFDVAEMPHDWYCTLNLLKILLEECQNHAALQHYQPIIENIICQSILKRRQGRGRTQVHLLIKRSNMELVLTYFKNTKTIEFQSHNSFRIMGYLLESIIFYRKELQLFQILNAIEALIPLLKAQMFVVTTGRNNKVRITKLIFSLLLRSQIIASASENQVVQKGENKSQFKNSNNLKAILEQVKTNRSLVVKDYNDFKKSSVLVGLREEIGKIKQLKSDNLKAAMKRFKKKIPLIEEILSLSLT